MKNKSKPLSPSDLSTLNQEIRLIKTLLKALCEQGLTLKTTTSMVNEEMEKYCENLRHLWLNAQGMVRKSLEETVDQASEKIAQATLQKMKEETTKSFQEDREIYEKFQRAFQDVLTQEQRILKEERQKFREETELKVNHLDATFKDLSTQLNPSVEQGIKTLNSLQKQVRAKNFYMIAAGLGCSLVLSVWVLFHFGGYPLNTETSEIYTLGIKCRQELPLLKDQMRALQEKWNSSPQPKKRPSSSTFN